MNDYMQMQHAIKKESMMETINFIGQRFGDWSNGFDKIIKVSPAFDSLGMSVHWI
jgi:hypothetical protein